jgi:hypothetical protein
MYSTTHPSSISSQLPVYLSRFNSIGSFFAAALKTRYIASRYNTILTSDQLFLLFMRWIFDTLLREEKFVQMKKEYGKKKERKRYKSKGVS